MDRMSLLGRALPSGVELRVMTLAPGESRAYVEADWRDALVVVEQGEIEVECQAGGRRVFAAGAVLFLTGLDLKSLHNRGFGQLVLSSVRRSDEFREHEESQLT
jgi:hypothetical protein